MKRINVEEILFERYACCLRLILKTKKLGYLLRRIDRWRDKKQRERETERNKNFIKLTKPKLVLFLLKTILRR